MTERIVLTTDTEAIVRFLEEARQIDGGCPTCVGNTMQAVMYWLPSINWNSLAQRVTDDDFIRMNKD